MDAVKSYYPETLKTFNFDMLKTFLNKFVIVAANIGFFKQVG